jgi:hypothetical protein
MLIERRKWKNRSSMGSILRFNLPFDVMLKLVGRSFCLEPACAVCWDPVQPVAASTTALAPGGKSSNMSANLAETPVGRVPTPAYQVVAQQSSGDACTGVG